MMVLDDYKYTIKYMHQYGNAVVYAIKQRIRQDRLIKTGALLNSIEYELDLKNNSFGITFTMGSGVFNAFERPLDPATYGIYLDQGTIYITPHYFFTAPIPGLTKTIYKQRIKESIKKDILQWAKKQLK